MFFLQFCCRVAAAMLFPAYSRAVREPIRELKGAEMTIVSLVVIHPNQGVGWEDVQKQIKKACDLARKHGAENVTVLATMIGGPATNAICLLSSAEDWGKFGQVQQSLMGDPDMQAAMLEAGQLATWETYVSQTIPDM